MVEKSKKAGGVSTDQFNLEMRLLEENFTCFMNIASDKSEGGAAYSLYRTVSGINDCKDVECLGYDCYHLSCWDDMYNKPIEEERAIAWFIDKEKKPAHFITLTQVNDIKGEDGEIVRSMGTIDEAELSLVPESTSKEVYKKNEDYADFRYYFDSKFNSMLSDLVLNYNSLKLDDPKFSINLVPIPKFLPLSEEKSKTSDGKELRNSRVGSIDENVVRIELSYDNHKFGELYVADRMHISDIQRLQKKYPGEFLDEKDVSDLQKLHPDKIIISNMLNKEVACASLKKIIFNVMDKYLQRDFKSDLRDNKYKRIVSSFSKEITDNVKDYRLRKIILKQFENEDYNKEFIEGRTKVFNIAPGTNESAMEILKTLYSFKRSAYKVTNNSKVYVKMKNVADLYNFDKQMEDLKQTAIKEGVKKAAAMANHISNRYKKLTLN